MKQWIEAIYIWLCAISLVTVRGVVFYSTADPQFNTSAPTGALEGSGWQLQGETFPGIPIGPSFFITATHVGGKVGDVFGFQGVGYTMVIGFPHPDADITVWKIAGTFPEYASLYSENDEVGKPLVVFGRGTQRGEEIRLGDALKGWSWGKSDGILRWGENVVAGISDADGNPTTSEASFQLLRADFDENGGANESHLSGGDSGGGVFIRDSTGVWKLAGVNHAANEQYSNSQTGPAFNATLFDEGGLFEGDPGKRVFHPYDPLNPQPGSFYATRLSAYFEWIQSVMTGSASTSVYLAAAASVLGPYTVMGSAIIDPVAQTITITAATGTTFYRVFSDVPHTIETIRKSGEQVVISYE